MRVPLTDLDKKTTICIDGDVYEIDELIGMGSSCLTYSAVNAEKNPFETKNPSRYVVIKEYYPVNLSSRIERREDGSLEYMGDDNAFDEGRKVFENRRALEQELYKKIGVGIISPGRNQNSFGTTYYLQTFKAKLLKEIDRDTLKLENIFEIMHSLCASMKEIHSLGYLYLDSKPDNIFFYVDEHKTFHAGFLDFDTMIKQEDLRMCIVDRSVIPFTYNWSPSEQVFGQINCISEQSDVYGLGAILFWLLTGRHPYSGYPYDFNRITDFDRINRNSKILYEKRNKFFDRKTNFDKLHGNSDAWYDGMSINYSGNNASEFYEKLRVLLLKTIDFNYYYKRYTNVDEFKEALSELENMVSKEYRLGVSNRRLTKEIVWLLRFLEVLFLIIIFFCFKYGVLPELNENVSESDVLPPVDIDSIYEDDWRIQEPYDIVLRIKYRKKGTKEWLVPDYSTGNSFERGEVIEWQVHCLNVSGEPIKNVELSLYYPLGFTDYSNDEVILYNTTNPEGMIVGNYTSSSTFNIGGYSDNGDAYVRFETEVNEHEYQFTIEVNAKDVKKAIVMTVIPV